MRVMQVRMDNQLLAGSLSTNSGDVEATMDGTFTEDTW